MNMIVEEWNVSLICIYRRQYIFHFKGIVWEMEWLMNHLNFASVRKSLAPWIM